MLSRLARILLLTTALLLALSGFAWHRARVLGAEAEGLRTESQAEAARYATSFVPDHQERELRLLDQRRAVLGRASVWNRGMLLGLALAVLSLFAAWVARELRAVRDAVIFDDAPAPRP